LLLQTYLAAALMYHGRPIASVRRIANFVVVAALSLVITGDLMAQVQSFGASDDPRESIQSVWWRHDQQLDVMAGPSLISRQWRAKGSVALNMESARSSLPALGATSCRSVRTVPTRHEHVV
jgi:hypothetical protein